MTFTLGIICILLMVLCLMLILMGLPGNWVIIGLAGLWSLLADAGQFSGKFFLLLIGLAALGEAIEFFAGYFGAKKFGGTNKGSLGGIIGALLGGILCAPILFGLGALPGALGGGFLGCFVFEKLHGMETKAALNAAWGATLGRFGGFLAKLGVAMALLCLTIPRIWAGM